MSEEVNQENLDKFVSEIKASDHIVVYSGEGVGSASRMPGSKTEEDAYQQADFSDKYSPQELQSSTLLEKDPAAVYDFLRKYAYSQEFSPNTAHWFTKQLENYGKDVTVISENMDNLHQRAGSTKVLDLYGNRYDFYCVECQTHYTIDELQYDEEGVPRCQKEGGLIRSTAICLDERPDTGTLNEIAGALRHCDLLIVLGTSIEERPLSLLLRFFDGDYIVNIDHRLNDYSGKKVQAFGERMKTVLNAAWDKLNESN